MTSPTDAHAHARALAARIAAFKGADDRRAALQLGGTLLGLACAWTLTAAAISAALWWALPPLWLLAAVMITRLFIMQHDCGHGAFLSKRWLNTAAGRLTSLFTFTPYGFWRYTHNRHHATTGDLDRGGIGDVFTASVEQYNRMTPRDRRRYRRFRNPITMMLIGVPIVFLLRYRTPFFQRIPAARCWRSILGLDLGLIALYGLALWHLGPALVLPTVLPSLLIATWIGGWMFYMQHQFEHGYWRPHTEWDWYTASLQGSSYYDLPAWLHWCTGHNGLHHIHHLDSTVPNYRLRACLEAIPELADINRITLRESFACAHLALWHEAGGRMITFAEADRRGLLASDG